MIKNAARLLLIDPGRRKLKEVNRLLMLPRFIPHRRKEKNKKEQVEIIILTWTDNNKEKKISVFFPRRR